MDQNELKHYGVLGMKWGIIRSPQKAYGKSVKKLTKINTKVEKRRAKAEKYYAKANKKLYGFMGSEKKAAKSFSKATAQMHKAEKLEYKGAKWYKQMNKNFAKTTVKKNPKAKAVGEKFIKSVNDRAERRYDARNNQAMIDAMAARRKKR